MTDLAALYPSLVGVSIVPAGITNYREGLCHLEPFTAEEAGEVIDTIDKFGEKCLKKFGTRLFFSSDELYIEAGRELPGEDYYEGYPQIENGVGMIRSMDGEFTDELDFLDEYDLEKPRKVSVATGAAAYDFIKSLADRLCEQVPTLECHVYKIINDFFGHNITVAGLLTGKDLANQLKGKDLGDRLLIPRVTLRSEGDVFLDDTTPEWLSEQLGGIEVVPVESTGNDFVSKVLF